jgi:Spy/CpxP family protein refolding chaperone
MRKLSLMAVATFAAVTLAAAQPALAKGSGWKAKGGNPHGFSQGRKLGWASAKRPPGWSHGRKTGWRGAQVPPGWSRWPD